MQRVVLVSGKARRTVGRCRWEARWRGSQKGWVNLGLSEKQVREGANRVLLCRLRLRCVCVCGFVYPHKRWMEGWPGESPVRARCGED